MDIRDKVVIVTGGAAGIGKALCARFAQGGARVVIVADRDAVGAQRVAQQIGGVASAVDVARDDDVQHLVALALGRFGALDVFCSNAGILVEGGERVANEEWQRIWEVNVMAHVYAARAALPHMLKRSEGYFLQTVSAAGLLNQIGAAPYGVSKHAALAFAEWLAITYGERGIKVSCLCPQGVRTKMLLGEDGQKQSFLLEGALTPEQVADAAVDGLAREQFLILPHPEVLEYFRRKASDYDRWVRGMQRLQNNIERAAESEKKP